MKYYLFGIAIILLLATGPVLALDIRGNIYNELAVQSLRPQSLLNPDNIQGQSEFQFCTNGNLIVKTSFGRSSHGYINLEGRYYPAAFSSQQEKEEIIIKALYLDTVTEYFSLRVGKHHINWGGNGFFNPIDVVNLKKQRLQPVDETIGNPFIHLTIPLKDMYALDFITIVEESRRIKSISELPCIFRTTFSKNRLSGFGFAEFQKEEKPIFGLNLEYAHTIDMNTSALIYGEASLKYSSQRRFIAGESIDYRMQIMEKDQFWAYVLGARVDKSLYASKWLEGVSFGLEYYYDDENWNRQNLQKYYEYLGFTRANNPENYLPALCYIEEFKNSKGYIYTSLSLYGFLVSDLNCKMEWIANIEDKSGTVVSGLTYSYDNLNAVCGIKVLCPYGGERTEFGEAVGGLRITLFSQVSF